MRGFHRIKKYRALLSRSEDRVVNCEWQSEGVANQMRSTTHTLNAWSSTEVDVAMSSAEAEVHANTEGSGRGMGMKIIVSGMGVVLNAAHLFAGSSAAKHVLSQRCLRKMRHTEVEELWLQAAVKEAKVHRIARESNPADLFTKHTDLAKLRHLSKAAELHILSTDSSLESRRSVGHCEDLRMRWMDGQRGRTSKDAGKVS